MIDFNQLSLALMTLSATFAALCIPAASVAYFIVANINEEPEQKRIASVISMAAFAGVVFVINTFMGIAVLLADACTGYYWVLIAGFCLGCILVVGIFLKIAGVRIARKLTLPSRGKPQLPDNEPRKA